ncbi:WD-REPEAT PROTEIN BING4, putative or Probable U3 small nucleolar RNA-associated protein 7 [Babesia bigemina]|uniref:WD-REPEAT PROTEIN BING4, putative or Probable U3 small nucleolar RNA-associated protein 7 n=1 Tax=Babesia bigemina TaxID=5866 RepID=A0A061D6Y5_BABBI|nr:WD-REPEAT PROTEIN BING4, putative or Probable U3 small nucleolar RNA-associated protein 7 [Babesia bigemina]CDR96466.1 WD-REPEAT PROTEIN BING4, putative or Probable U3 small nucleolar RNA-associated protein 7 [Babesia bigemina]|eukprot:XP_012768652.1 WD-REPEAT PROTEIN BING4, putative or Probable U3 small nucleolar RNA-associated protein 7 [Babesia bigemina]
MAAEVRDTKVFHAKFFGGKAEKFKQAQAQRNVQKYKKVHKTAKAEADATSVLLPNQAGFLQVGEDEKTYNVSQAQILDAVDVGTRRKSFSLQLQHGPYRCDYTRDGRYMLLGGEKGQLALFDAIDMKPCFDISVKQTIRDIQLLDNHELLAVAQKKYVHVYDNNGVEVYCLRDLGLTYQLEYMAPFWLMAAIGEFGELSWQDITSGEVVARYKTRKGPCKVMRHNKDNGVIHLGHTSGVVTLWTPNEGRPGVEMLAHKGPVVSMAVHNHYMATSGFDGFWNVWDLRNYSKAVSRQFTGRTPPEAMAVSQTGILAMAIGGRVEYYRDAFSRVGGAESSLYLKHQFPAESARDIKFQPFEDVCAVGTTTGVSTLLVPGAGIANFDAFAPNPYEPSSKKQVQRMLDKIPYDTITVKNVEIGAYNRDYTAAESEEGASAPAATVDSGGEILKNTRKKRRSMKAKTASKVGSIGASDNSHQVAAYERTFQRRQQAARDRLRNLRKQKVAGQEAKQHIIDAMTFEDSTGERRVRGSVRGAALSRFAKKQ